MTAKQTTKRTSRPSHAHRSAARRNETDTPGFSRTAAKGFLITLGIGAALLLAAALCVYFLPDPSPAIRPTGVAVALLTALAGGYVSGKLHGHAPALCGLLNGALLSALMLLLSLFLRSDAAGYSAWISALLHAMIPLCSVVGAMMGVRKKSTPKRRRR